MRRTLLILAFFAIAVVLWIVFEQARLPPGVESKGPAELQQWVTLAGAIVSTAAGVIALILKVVELRNAKK